MQSMKIAGIIATNTGSEAPASRSASAETLRQEKVSALRRMKVHALCGPTECPRSLKKLVKKHPTGRLRTFEALGLANSFSPTMSHTVVHCRQGSHLEAFSLFE